MPAHASLNRIYRLVWSALHQTWVVASELARGRGKSNATPLISAALLVSLAGLSGGVGAAPQGGQVVAGSGSISASDATTTINQASDKLSINWQSFNVGTSETVNFVQPSASALAVNRILDTQGSQILGKINANGQVWLINPNGVLFGRDAQINVGGLLASTLNPDDASIGSARSNFSGSSTAAVVNLGSINAAQGGYVALLGHSVSNQGSISAPGGTVALGAGSAVSLNFAGSKLLGLEVTSNQVNALAENGGLIQADGGQVLLSAGARESLLASVVNNTGVIQARTVQEKDGKIILLGGMAAGTTNVKGTLDASAPNGGNGGFIETSAYTVNVSDSASITTASAQGKQGQWLIDPYDFYIAASGGNITGKALGDALKNNDVTIQTTDSGTSATGASATGGNSGNGDIFVNDTVSWSSGKTLTLDAWNNIYINSAINASGGTGGKLALLYGQSSDGGGSANYFVNAPVTLKEGANFSTKLGSTGITTDYTVITSLGAEGDQGRSGATNSLQGLGDSTRLSGNYVLGEDIDASRTSTWNSNSGFAPIGTLSTHFTGTFDGLGHTITGLTINLPESMSSVGLFGTLGNGGVVRNVGLLNASVIGRDYVGGLVGGNEGSVSNSYVSGSVSASITAGGLVGVNSGSISNSYATGSVSGVEKVVGAVGGLVGFNNGGEISNSYATASVSGKNGVGGLVGENGGSISNSYATGRVNSDGDVVGGLVGYNNFDTSPGTITNSIWDVNTTGQPYSDGSDFEAWGWSTAHMMSLASYTTGDGNPNWDFTNTWYMVDGATRPFLRSEWSTTVRNTHQLQLMAMKPGSSYTLANDLNLTADLANSSSMWKTGDGFSPIGSATTPFTGSFDGQGHTITGLTINRSSTDDVGLFGIVGTGGVVQNVRLVNAIVSGQNNVGGLAGFNKGTVSNSYATGSVSGVSNVGGLVGKNDGGDISTSYATVVVTPPNNTGPGTDTPPPSNSAALTPTQPASLVPTTSLVPVISRPPLPSGKSFAESAQLALTTPPFNVVENINTFAATAAGTGSPVTSLGGTGLVYVAAQGVSMGTGTITGPEE